jgi:catechol 2,3-dioxygenase-like lactoylglutathione lyase family enzyme
MADTGESAGDLRVGTVVINVQDMSRAVDFWTAVLGYVPRDPDGNEFCVIDHPE